MSRDALSKTDVDLDRFATHLAEYVTANATLVGLTPALATQMTDLAKVFNVALEASVNPETRSGSKIQAKRTARKNLVTFLRPTIRVIQACLTTTDDMRYDMALPIRKTHGTPAPMPNKAVLSVAAVRGNVVDLRVSDPAHPLKRSLPKDVQGISVFSYVGEAPTTDISKWTFEGNTGRQKVSLTMPANLAPGTKVFLTAFFFNGKKNSGAAADPVGVYLGGGAVSQPGAPEMKLAA